MACPRCGCKVHYGFDGATEDLAMLASDEMQRCAGCGAVFSLEDSDPLPDDDEDDGPRWVHREPEPLVMPAGPALEWEEDSGKERKES